MLKTVWKYLHPGLTFCCLLSTGYLIYLNTQPTQTIRESTTISSTEYILERDFNLRQHLQVNTLGGKYYLQPHEKQIALVGLKMKNGQVVGTTAYTLIRTDLRSCAYTDCNVLWSNNNRQITIIADGSIHRRADDFLPFQCVNSSIIQARTRDKYQDYSIIGYATSSEYMDEIAINELKSKVERGLYDFEMFKYAFVLVTKSFETDPEGEAFFFKHCRN